MQVKSALPTLLGYLARRSGADSSRTRHSVSLGFSFVLLNARVEISENKGLPLLLLE